MEIGTHLLVSKNNYYFCVCTRGVYAFFFFYYDAFSYYMECSAFWLKISFSDLAFISVFFHFLRYLCFNKVPLICAASVKRFFLLTPLRMVLSLKIIYGTLIYVLWPHSKYLYFLALQVYNILQFCIIKHFLGNAECW